VPTLPKPADPVPTKSESPTISRLYKTFSKRILQSTTKRNSGRQKAQDIFSNSEGSTSTQGLVVSVEIEEHSEERQRNGSSSSQTGDPKSLHTVEDVKESDVSLKQRIPLEETIRTGNSSKQEVRFDSDSSKAKVEETGLHPQQEGEKAKVVERNFGTTIPNDEMSALLFAQSEVSS
jgi:hypothetical protein